MLRGFQAGRPSLYDFGAQMRKITVPTLIVVGDEDEPCLEPASASRSGFRPRVWWCCPKPATWSTRKSRRLFNEAVADFIARVEAGRWPARDPRSVRGSIQGGLAVMSIEFLVKNVAEIVKSSRQSIGKSGSTRWRRGCRRGGPRQHRSQAFGMQRASASFRIW